MDCMKLVSPSDVVGRSIIQIVCNPIARDRVCANTFPKFDMKNLVMSLDLDRDLCDRGIPLAWPRADLDLHEIVVDCDLVASALIVVVAIIPSDIMGIRVDAARLDHA